MAKASSRTEMSVDYADTYAALRSQLEELRSDRLVQLAEVCEASVEENELAAPRQAELRRVLRDIDAALERLDNGDYGTCGGCRAQIPVERLQIVPYARYCVACQQAGEHRRP